MSTLSKTSFIVLSIIVIALFCLLVYFQKIPSEAVFGFLGVLVGSLIAGIVQYATSDANLQQQLRLAALDKRIQAHQDAYAKWQSLRFTNRPSKEYNELILHCQDWWNNNCLYLTAEAREAFKKAYIAAEYFALPASLQAGRESTQKDVEVLNCAGEIIVKGVYLPSIGELESKRVEKRP